jgi:site-specific DNA-cytosine methylase
VLFTGIGGGILGLHDFTRPVVAVEISPFCRTVLKRRQRTRRLDAFPVWDDIATFNGGRWRNQIDLVTGGFPCQAFSLAHHGMSVSKDWWPEMLRVIHEARPSLVFAENVVETVITRAAHDCNCLGYRSSIVCLRASDVGAPHIRRRYWLLAYTSPEAVPDCSTVMKSDFWQTPPAGYVDGDPKRKNRGQNYLQRVFGGNFRVHTPTGAANFTAPCMQRHLGCSNFTKAFGADRPNPEVLEWLMGLPPGWTDLGSSSGDWAERYTAIGNAQVPHVAKAAFQFLCHSVKDSLAERAA